MVEVRDNKTGQALLIMNEGALAAFALEDARWDQGEAHTDGVVVGDLDGSVVVVFLELTGSLSDERKRGKKESPAQHKLRQLAGAVGHFHPTGTQSGGDKHHERFASGKDPIQPRPSVDHRVVAIVVAERQGSGEATPPVLFGKTSVARQFRRISHPPRQVPSITLRDLVDPPDYGAAL